MNDDYWYEYEYYIDVKNEFSKAGINMAFKPFSIPALIILMSGQNAGLEPKGIVM